MYLLLSNASGGSSILDSQGIGTINNVDPNTPPTAYNDRVSLPNEFGYVTKNLVANDFDPDGDPMTITSVTQPANAVVTIISSTTVGIAALFPGTFIFSYTISDGNGGTDSAQVAVTVQGGGGGRGRF